jgi:hypothetical protein
MRTRAGRFVRSLETSGAFQKFSANGPSANISEFDFRDMLLGTMESSEHTLQNNLEQFRQFATLCRRADLVEFLNECQRKFGRLLVVQCQRRFAGVF